MKPKTIQDTKNYQETHKQTLFDQNLPPKPEPTYHQNVAILMKKCFNLQFHLVIL